MSDKFFVGLDITGFENNGKTRPISRVTLMVDDNNAITAGDDTGSELVADCPFATQEMVNTILSNVKGYEYQMYSGDNAGIDPSFELGDGVTIGGVYSTISKVEDDGSGYATLSAPGGEELEDEYPSSGPMTQEFNRQIAQTRSYIEKSSEEIRLAIESVTGEVTELKVTIDGVTITDSTGTTKIKGSSIETDTLYVNSANITGTLTADQINLTGSITWGDLASDAQSQVTSAQSTALNAYGLASSAQISANTANSQISAWTYPGSTMINGNMLMTGTVMATQLLGGYVGLLNQYQQPVGNMTIGMATTGYAVELNSTGGLRLSSYGNFWIDSAYGTLGITASGVVAGGNCVPGAGSRYSLGAPGLNWTQVYADNGTIVTSDRNQKSDITYNMQPYSAFFDLLKPTPYKLKSGTSGRVHLGLISQDVESELSDVGLSSLEFAGFIKSTTEDGDLYALRYEEFIPLLIYEVQKLKKRVAELEAA